jgi:hypothetical protein
MKTLIFYTAFLCLLYSCSDSTQESTKNTSVDTTNRKVVVVAQGKLTADQMKETFSYRDSDIYIKFGRFIPQKNYIHDNYGVQYKYNQAERGELYITCQIRVTAKSKDPTLPIFCAYSFGNGVFIPMGTFDYNFTQWQDYGTYLGNNADFGNDFAHTATIPFNIGLAVEKSKLKSPVYIMALKSPCVVRSEERFREPPVKYDDGSCVTGGDITSLDQLKNFILIKIINQPSQRKRLANNRNEYGGIDYGFIVSLPKNGKEPPQKKGYIAVTGKNRNGHDTVLYIKGEQ